MSPLSSLPSVEKILHTDAASGLASAYGRPLTVEAIRFALEAARGELKVAPNSSAPAIEVILSQAEARLSAWTRPSLQPVINATGVVLHTNLGRAPLSMATIEAMEGVSRGYSNLELDLETGKRGQRFVHAEAILQTLTGAEAALVVNNNASAVLLVLSALAAKKRVIIARSQLVEIGGGFRMPDVMKQSSARLVEVGTTNRVRVSDYRQEFAGATMVMRVHRSNFKMVGFTEEPDFKQVATEAHQAGLIVVDDLGSGALVETAKYGLAHEPTVQNSLEDGADVACFSGDKLVGGPQAGILVGGKELLEKIRKHPLARAVRADKTCLAGIAATLTHYLKNEAESELPIWRMISMPLETVRARAERWARELGEGEVQENQSTLGGGSLPGESIPSYVLALSVGSPDRCLKRLREQRPPIIARTEHGRVLLDPRTVLEEQETPLLSGLRAVLLEVE